MKQIALLPRVTEQNGVFLCSDLSHRDSPRRYRVPVEHRQFEMFGKEFDDALRAVASAGGGETARQIISVLKESGGIGLFAAKGWPVGGPDGTREVTQEEYGALLIFPPQLWSDELEQLRQWMPDGFAGYGEVPYDLNDVMVFAKLNFSPDCWYYVTRGPMQGKICRWQHDDDSDPNEVWADDFVAWTDRVWRDVPGLFGGITRWNKAATPDADCPANAELFPEKFLLE